ncbi:MAG: ABC transporter ATP-binding protein [Thermomicrobiales bacterium]
MARVVDQFRRWFTQPDDDEEAAVTAAPSVPLREIIRRFWPDARPYRRWLPLLLLFVALGPALDTAAIWLYKLLIDEVLVPRDFGFFPQIALAYLALTLLGGLISFGDDVLSEWMGERFLVDLRSRVFAHMQRLPLDFFAGKRRGDLIARLTGDVAEIETLIISGITDLFSYGMRILFFAGALFYLNWRLALLAFVVAPFFWLVSQVVARQIKRVAREQRRRTGAISAVAEEVLGNAPLVQAYNRQEAEVGRFRREALGNFAAQMALTRLRALFDPLLESFQLGGVLVVVGAGTWELSQGNLTLGGLLVFLTYLTQVFGPVQSLVQLVNSVAAASAGAERVIEVLDQPPAILEREDAHVLGPAHGHVIFDAVSFRYPRAQELALDDVSFTVAPGETLAIVGASGAGKSTIARLLLRFYDPASGRIAIDGHDLRDVELPSLRDSIAVVLQESLVVAGTVRDNIAYGRPEATDEEIVRAAKAADAHRFIMSLPQGYDTVIGQDGARLSGGQRQRLAIARAMVRNAPVLILDEPTTGLDAVSSDRVMRPLRRLMEGRATIVISHNLMTVREATEIAVLDGGRIVERGTHNGLLALNGAYASLYRLHHPDLDLVVAGNGRELAGVT